MFEQRFEKRTIGTLSQPVFFIGFMGAGKTSVARRVARNCGIASVDMDTYLERREGRKVKEIFAQEGEETFRRIETSVLKELLKKEPLLISCGGGIVKEEVNRDLLRSGGYVVFLKVEASEARERISDISSRPLFQDDKAAQALAQERLPLYEEIADFVVDTAGKHPGVLARIVQQKLEREGILCLQQK